MKQVFCPATGVIEIIEGPVPPIQAGELLVRMAACGICGTDLMKVYDPTTPKPVQLGHEIAGQIVEVGKDVIGFVQGQRVAVAHHAPDFASHFAKRGSETQDPNFKASNVAPGGFAEFIRVPAHLVPHTVHAIPDGMPYERAAFMEPLACCLRALDRVPAVSGDTVLVVGVGAIGLLFMPLLRHLHAKVIAADVRTERLAMAHEWGADDVGIVGKDDLPQLAQRYSDGRGADQIILTIVNPATIDLAMSSVRDGGWIIPFGVKPGMIPPVDLWQMYRREISLVTSYSATPEGLAKAMALLAKPGFELEKTISHRFPLAHTAEGFALLHSASASKIVIESRP